MLPDNYELLASIGKKLWQKTQKLPLAPKMHAPLSNNFLQTLYFPIATDGFYNPWKFLINSFNRKKLWQKNTKNDLAPKMWDARPLT